MMITKDLLYKLICFRGMTGINVHAFNKATNKFENMEDLDLSVFMSCVCVEKLLLDSACPSAVTMSCGLLFGKLSLSDNTDLIVGPIIVSNEISESLSNITKLFKCPYLVNKNQIMQEMSMLAYMKLFDFERYLLLLKQSVQKKQSKQINAQFMPKGQAEKGCVTNECERCKNDYMPLLISLPNSFEEVEFYEKAKSENEDALNFELADCIGYIHNNIHETLSLEKIAHHCGYNPSYLSRKFKQVLGINLSKYITNLRLNKAAEFLKTSKKSLAEISAFLAFSSQSHFQNTFKSYYNMTPLEYRKLDNVQSV